MLKKAVLSLMILLFVAAPGPAAARDMPGGKWWHRPQVAEAVDITDGEKKALDEAFLQSSRELIDLKSGVKKEMLELEHLLAKEDAAESAIMERFEQVQSARNQLGTAHFRFLLEAREILGVERFGQLKSHFKKCRHRHGKGGSRRGPGGPPEETPTRN
jgi:Spy/CpxP family protein refolding chaperone